MHRKSSKYQLFADAVGALEEELEASGVAVRTFDDLGYEFHTDHQAYHQRSIADLVLTSQARLFISTCKVTHHPYAFAFVLVERLVVPCRPACRTFAALVDDEHYHVLHSQYPGPESQSRDRVGSLLCGRSFGACGSFDRRILNSRYMLGAQWYSFNAVRWSHSAKLHLMFLSITCLVGCMACLP